MINFISYKFVDVKGNLKDKLIQCEPNSYSTAFIDGSSLGYRPDENSDLMLIPDLNTIHYDPIRETTGIFCFLADMGGNNLKSENRNIALEAFNFDQNSEKAIFGAEFEFYILENSKITETALHLNSAEFYQEFDDNKWYCSLPPIDKLQDIRMKIAETLNATNWIEVESLHHEFSPNQVEITLKYDNVLYTADKIVLAKYIIASVCDQEGYKACFDPKPFETLNGNGFHIHQSIPAMKDNFNLIFDYAKGLIKNHDELLKICASGPTSIKRFTAGYGAPVKSVNDLDNIGLCDRTKIIRIPITCDRLEYRLPDHSMNAYVGLSHMLKFGLEGIQ